MGYTLGGISPLLKKTCARLIGADRSSIAAVACAEGKSPWAIYKRRRRFERKLGVILPRMHRVGRPIVSCN